MMLDGNIELTVEDQKVAKDVGYLTLLHAEYETCSEMRLAQKLLKEAH